MYKVLAVILIFGAAGFAYYLIGGDSSGLPSDNATVESEDVDTIKEALKETGKRTVYGSCNAIQTGSNCVDYVGSMWNDNNMAQLNCSDAGTFSTYACPYSDFGGCQTHGGTVMEIIAWVYKEGPGEYNEESVPYARASCNSLPNAKWVTPSDLLK